MVRKWSGSIGTPPAGQNTRAAQEGKRPPSANPAAFIDSGALRGLDVTLFYRFVNPSVNIQVLLVAVLLYFEEVNQPTNMACLHLWILPSTMLSKGYLMVGASVVLDIPTVRLLDTL